MEYSITLLSRDPKALVEFWIKALSLHARNKFLQVDGEYDFVDLYYRNQKVMTVVKSTIDTTGLQISIRSYSIRKEYAKLTKRDLNCEWFPQKQNLFSVKDPQGNWLSVCQHPNFMNLENES